MPKVGEWIHFDLRCYTCDGDLWLSEYESLYHCSPTCSITSALSDEYITTFTMVLDRIGLLGYLNSVGSLPVADAMLEPHYMRGAGREGKQKSRDQPDGLRSYQWRTVRLQQLESLVTPE